jgi:predicted dehydrogenase
VYSEKPLATSLEEGRELELLAAERDTVLLCAPATVVFPVWQMARELIGQGAIGRPLAMRARFEMPPLPWRRHATGATWFTAPGVGPLRDIGIYALHAMLDLFGYPETVACQAASVLGGRRNGARAEQSPDAFSLLLGFADDRVASLETGFFVHASLMPWAEIYGDRGTVAISMRDQRAPIRVCEIAQPGDQPAWREISADTVIRTVGRDVTGADDWFDYMAGIEEFVDVIGARRDSPLSARRACEVLDVIDRAYLAARLA